MIDRIIVSSDDSDFLNFWPIVAKAWNKFLPSAKITLAFITDREEMDPIFNKINSFGDVYIFPRDHSIPAPNQAKICRHILACLFKDEVSMIEDIDTVPLQKDFILRIANEYEDGKILLVGEEVYNNTSDEGKIPISNMTGKGNEFSNLFDPLFKIESCLHQNRFNKDIFSLWDNLKNLEVFDHKESILNIPDLSGLNGFSDESMIRAIIHKYDLYGVIKKIDRSVNIKDRWIDRSWWNVEDNKLKSEYYVICNFMRPIKENYLTCKPVIDFVCENNTTLDLFLV